MDQADFSDCLRQCGHCHWLFSAQRRRKFVRRRCRQRKFRLGRKLDSRRCDAGLLYPVSCICQVLLEAALCAVRLDCRLYSRRMHAHGGLFFTGRHISYRHSAADAVRMEFRPDAIVSVVLIFLVSATETTGDTSALAASGLGRDVTEKETSGSIACDGFISSLSSVLWLPADYIVQPKRRSGCDDQGCQSLHHCNRRSDYDSCRRVPDVRAHCSQRCRMQCSAAAPL